MRSSANSISRVQSITTTGDNAIEYEDTLWDDMRFPFIGRNIDTTSGRLDYDYAEMGVNFQSNARYAVTEQVSCICQMHHDYKLESQIHPHLHWFQNANNIPNWLLVYRKYRNGDAVPSTWVEAVSTPVVSYTSGTILQISNFPLIDMTGIDTVSGFVDFKLYRDTANASGLFAGADPYSGSALSKEFDIHYQRDMPGSRSEFTK